jgi:hypothetical protein
VIARRSNVSGIALKSCSKDWKIFSYVVDNNTFINHLPMQKVILRPEPVFMLVSAHSSVSGDSLEPQKYFASLALVF